MKKLCNMYFRFSRGIFLMWNHAQNIRVNSQNNSEYGHFSRIEYFDRKPWIWIEKPVISMEYDCHIFSKYLRISNEKPSISIEILGISNQKF